MHEELAIARFASVADKEKKGYMDLYVIPTLYEVPKGKTHMPVLPLSSGDRGVC